MEILFETDQYWIVCKPAGMISESKGGAGIADLLAAQNGGYAGVIHRLDREVSGLMAYAKTPSAAAWLSRLAQAHLLEKEYLAAVVGAPEKTAGELRDLLYYDRQKNKVFPVSRPRNGVKEAVLQYRTICEAELDGIGHSTLVAIDPITGRTHQIRVQFASRGHALIGDRRYGGPTPPTAGLKGRILLACRKLVIPEPDGKREFYREPDWITLFSGNDKKADE